MRPCAVIGIGQTKYAAKRHDVNMPMMVREAAERALADADPSVRIAACSAMALSIGYAAQTKLVRALYDDSPGVRAEAAWLLGDLGSELAREHLELWSSDPSRDDFGDRVGSVAKRALNRIEFARRSAR